MVLHLLRMRRNVNRNVFNDRKNVSATPSCHYPTSIDEPARDERTLRRIGVVGVTRALTSRQPRRLNVIVQRSRLLLDELSMTRFCTMDISANTQSLLTVVV